MSDGVAIMSGKNRRDYKNVTKYIHVLIKFIIFRNVLEDPQIRSCAFHYDQALFRKVQELGLYVSLFFSSNFISYHGALNKKINYTVLYL